MHSAGTTPNSFGAARRGSRWPRRHEPADPPHPGRVPAGKTLHDWDQQASCIPRPTQGALTSLESVTRRENVYICGPSGTGKSHFCQALSHAAVEAGMTVAWFTIEDLGALVRRHRANDSITRSLARLIRTDLIIIDDIGLLAVSPDAAEGSTGSSTPPTNAAPSPSPATCTRPVSTRSCPRPRPPPQ